MSKLPSGTVTFVFSDIEGSTSLLKRLGDAGYAAALATHRQLVRSTFAEHGGEEIDTQGDAFFYSFPRARSAVNAAVAVQLAHTREAWPEGVEVRIRLGLHTGEPAVDESGYTGLDVVRASRIAAAARGGQVLMSETTRALVGSGLPDGVTVRSAGERKLKDIDQPEPLAELVIAGVAVTSAQDSALVPSQSRLPKEIAADMPEWLQGVTERYLPAANKLIEERVLAEIKEGFDERKKRRRRDIPDNFEPALAPPPGDRPTVADEITRLQVLRESGALSEEQYQRAVERALRERR